MKEKEFRLELSAENPISRECFYTELDVPAEDYEIQDAMQKLRAVGKEGGVWVSILERESIPELDDVRLDSPTIEELDFFARRLATMTKEERIVFEAVAGQIIPEDIEGDSLSVKDLINSTYGLDRVPVIPNVSNIEELGRFVLENGMNEDIEGVPEEAFPYLSVERIGQIQKENDGGMFARGYYVAAGQYERPEIYDGKTLPEKEKPEMFVFRLKVAEVPVNDAAETEETAEWIKLPIDRGEADRIAGLHNEGCIEECVYFEFESSIPQITEEQFTDMLDFDKLNLLAGQIAAMSPSEQVKFKAVLCAEQPEDISRMMEAAKSLSQYEFSATSDNYEQFFREYILHHMDSRFDSGWMDTLLTRNEGRELLERLGASITDYGVISARGRSLYEFVPHKEAEVEELAGKSTEETDMDEDEEIQMGEMQI